MFSISPKNVVRENTEQFFIERDFPIDGKISKRFTSGTTGEPMEVRGTALSAWMNMKENTRLQEGWPQEGIETGLAILAPSETKPAGTLEKKFPKPGYTQWSFYSLDTNAALDILLEKQAQSLLGYPSLVSDILDQAANKEKELPLRFISTIGETVSDDLLFVIEQKFGCSLYDTYGAIETGVIAGRCALCKNYHPADRHAIVEVLDEQKKPVKPGNSGKVVVTTLFNSAMPLLRYEIGDIATLSESVCANSKMSISRIDGREMHLFRTIGGRKFVPRIPPQVLNELGLRQYRLVQKKIDEVELHYVPGRVESIISEETAQNLINSYLDPSFKAVPIQKAELPRLENGKNLWHEAM